MNSTPTDIKELMNNILDTALKVSTEKSRISAAFRKSGVEVTEEMKVGEITGDPQEALTALMSNLTEMAVVKIAAKQVIRRSGARY